MGRNRVVIYPDWCKGCGICAAFCPKKVLAVGLDGKARVVNEEACVNCGFCEPHCPDFAIVVIPEGEPVPPESAPLDSKEETP
ncbi:4Fe-4S dicluster domain-containing protein [Desulfovibrio sp. TomC]|uniref:4Fe-4S dicluster domain-containing protein n=1 Tax=Desulfovibrio sp. TomC TaxID=1562888 RepID=UPI0005731F2C|nr:4Fe-4S binding protein [Desulfovibrio sp. TomC]KHK02786.1 putative 2-oxoglutarate oxidoreductase, delta subunit [Desulfovibrio sp. TomC]